MTKQNPAKLSYAAAPNLEEDPYQNNCTPSLGNLDSSHDWRKKFRPLIFKSLIDPQNPEGILYGPWTLQLHSKTKLGSEAKGKGETKERKVK